MAETRIIPGVGTVRKNDDGTFEVIAPATAATPQVSAIPLPANPVKVAKEAQEAARQAEKDRQDAIKFGERNAPNLQAGFRWKNGVVGGEAEPIPGTTNNDAAKLSVIPGAAATGIQENISSLRKAEIALAALDATNGRPQSVGPGTGALGQYFLNWHDPDGTKTRAAVAAIGAQKIHDLSGAAVSASEAPRFQPFVPTVTDTPDVARDKLLQFREQLRQQIKESVDFYSPANGYRPYTTPAINDFMAGQPGQHADKEVDPATGATKADTTTAADPGDLPPANMPGGNDPTPPPPGPAASGGGFQDIAHPEVASMVQSMLAAGAGYSTINAALKQKNASPLSFSDYNRAKQFMANPANRGQAYPVTASERRPLTMLERAAGSAPGAFAASMANSATAGFPAYLAGDEGAGALDAMGELHPTASTLGSITGGITGALGLEAGAAGGAGKLLANYAPNILRAARIAGKAPGLVRAAPRVSDAVYGAVSGATGAEDGNRGLGALEGAATGLVGGYVGEKTMHAVGSGLRGVTDPLVEYLRSRGVPLTVGQVVGRSGRVGQFVKGMEDALTSVPGPGNMVDARRTEGLEGFNRAAFQDAGAPGAQIDTYGAPGMRQVRQSVGDAYDQSLLPSQIDTVNDPQLIQAGAQALLAANAIPNVQPSSPSDFSIASLQNRLGNVDPNGMMSGRNFQEAYRGLARDARSRATSDLGHEIGQVARQGQDALGEALERQNPGAFDGFIEANAANRRANVLADALRNAANQGDELITPAQLNRADVTSTSRLEGKINSAAGNRPFYDLAAAGQAVLPSKLPDSGTAKRLAAMAIATGGLGAGGGGVGYLDGNAGAGAAGGVGTGAILAALLTAGGTKAGQKLLTGALLNRTAIDRATGALLQRNAKLGSGFGAGVLTPLLVGP